MEVDAYLMAQKFITDKLKSPSTAQYPTSDYKFVASDADSTFKIISYVDSQNGFGAMIRSHYTIILKYKGRSADDRSGEWELLHLDFNDPHE